MRYGGNRVKSTRGAAILSTKRIFHLETTRFHEFSWFLSRSRIYLFSLLSFYKPSYIGFKIISIEFSELDIVFTVYRNGNHNMIQKNWPRPTFNNSSTFDMERETVEAWAE